MDKLTGADELFDIEKLIGADELCNFTKLTGADELINFDKLTGADLIPTPAWVILTLRNYFLRVSTPHPTRMGDTLR